MRNWQKDKALLSPPRPYLFNSRKKVDISARFLIDSERKTKKDKTGRKGCV